MYPSRLIGLLLACAWMLCGCGGGSSAGSAASASSSNVNNIQPLIVDAGPPAAGGTVNEPFVSITVCSPSAPTVCQTIDHILVDTGSSGLRLMSSVLSSSLSLPQQTDANGNALAECTTFADGYTWGSLRTVNLQIAGESVKSLTVQLIGDPNSGTAPTSCSGTGVAENTVPTFGANGVLGVGPSAQDCGSTCVQNADANIYYLCNTSPCQSTTLALAQQVQNPVTLFASDNNGVLISLPTVAAGGAANVSGSLIFGVGTQSDNSLGNAQIYPISTQGYFTTTYKGVSYPDSLLDTGSNGYFFNDASIPPCSDNSGFYCPTSTLSLSASNQAANNVQVSINFSVGSETTLINNPSLTAFPLLAGVNGDPSGFDWGLPFFFGRNVFTVIEGKSTTGGTGPYFAF